MFKITAYLRWSLRCHLPQWGIIGWIDGDGDGGDIAVELTIIGFVGKGIGAIEIGIGYKPIGLGH